MPSSILDAWGRPYSYYEGASYANRFREFRRSNPGPNVPVESELATLWSRSRQLNRNDAWSIGALESYVDEMIATGIDPEPVFPLRIKELLGSQEAEGEKATEIRDAWNIWGLECDTYGMSDIYGIQGQVLRTVVESGECFVRRRIRRPQDGLYVPLQLQVLEPDFVPYTKMDGARFPDTNVVRAGIEFDSIGRRVGYHMYREHPGDMQKLGSPVPETVFVPASDVLHVAELRRAGQIRFEPKSTPIIKLLLSMGLSNEANLVLQQVCAMFGGFITRELGDIPPRSFDGQETPDPVANEGQPNALGVADAEMEPGMFLVGEPGMDVKFNSPPDIGNNYLPFNAFQLQAISRSYGLPYHAISGDMTDASFASLRADQNKMKRHILRMLGWFKHQFCQGTYSWFVREAVLAGLLDLPDYSIVPKLWHIAIWNHVGWESTNPLQDANAAAVELAWGIESRRRKVAQRGGNVRDIDRENAEDQARARELGLTYKGMEGANTTRGEQVGPFSDDTVEDDTEDTDDAA